MQPLRVADVMGPVLRAGASLAPMSGDVTLVADSAGVLHLPVREWAAPTHLSGGGGWVLEPTAGTRVLAADELWEVEAAGRLCEHCSAQLAEALVRGSCGYSLAVLLAAGVLGELTGRLVEAETLAAAGAAAPAQELWAGVRAGLDRCDHAGGGLSGAAGTQLQEWHGGRRAALEVRLRELGRLLWPPSGGALRTLVRCRGVGRERGGGARARAWGRLHAAHPRQVVGAGISLVLAPREAAAALRAAGGEVEELGVELRSSEREAREVLALAALLHAESGIDHLDAVLVALDTLHTAQLAGEGERGGE